MLEDEFSVEARGLLRAGQTLLPYTQFCVNPVQQYNLTFLQAKVDYQFVIFNFVNKLKIYLPSTKNPDLLTT